MTFVAIALLVASAKAQIVGASRLMTNSGGENAAYTGVGRFTGPLTCTAFFISPPTPSETAPAYVMAAGHCIDTSSANLVTRDRALNNARVVFNYFRDTQSQQITVPARTAVYSTMKGLDLSVIELNSTYGDLIKRGVRPLELSATSAQQVAVVGAPYANIPTDEAFLRIAHCELAPPVDLIEYYWHFFDSYPNTCSDISSGSSGSPVIDKGSGKVVALMNTTSAGATLDSGDFPCFNGQPCEVTAGGFVYRKDTNYAVPLHDVLTCFDDNARFNADLAACKLDRGRQLTLSAPLRAVQPKARWNVRITGDAFAQYRYKVVREGFGDCRSTEGYGAFTNASVIADELPEEDARYYLCVLGDGQPARFPSMVHTRVDKTPPSIPIPFTFFESETAYIFEPIFTLPELVDYTYKIIEPGGPTCAESSSYSRYVRIPIRVPKTSGRFCMIGVDEAGNATPAVEVGLQGPNVFPMGVLNSATLKRGPVAPGAFATVFGVNLTQQRLTIIDSAGQSWPITNLYQSANQINFRIPSGAALGAATLAFDNRRIAFTLEANSPGLFSASGMGGGAANGFAIQVSTRTPLFSCVSPAACTPAPVDVPSNGDPFYLELYATGSNAAPAATIAGLRLPTEVISNESGLQRLRITIAGDFPLRGYLPVRILVQDVTGNTVFVRFR